MTSDEPRFKRLPSGNYQISLNADDRRVLRDLPQEMIKLLESGDDDGSMFRLFPPGYANDIGRQIDYDRLMRDELQSRHIQALRLLQDTAEEGELSEDQLEGWMRAINQFRLVLETRLDITQDFDWSSITEDDPRISGLVLYEYLGHLQQEAIDTLSDAYDTDGRYERGS